ncbi:hypothetical protein NPIL_240321 [Nephila pilipes]|uniref:Uncharacterized protein n=1 Tax=Nephila pilipes TaxID=299642 RepID=A0A8X6MDN2_NEPPI|nr:hypothetical protein NPIL_240321 [Nephila pilipes]
MQHIQLSLSQRLDIKTKTAKWAVQAIILLKRDRDKQSFSIALDLTYHPEPTSRSVLSAELTSPSNLRRVDFADEPPSCCIGPGRFPHWRDINSLPYSLRAASSWNGRILVSNHSRGIL